MPNASDNFGDPDICDTKKNKAAKITFSLNTMILRELGRSLNLILHYRASDFYSWWEEQLPPLRFHFSTVRSKDIILCL